MKNLFKRCVVLKAMGLLFAASQFTYLSAQLRSCDLTRQVTISRFNGSLRDAAGVLSKAGGVSVVVEASGPYGNVTLPAGTNRLSDLVSRLDTRLRSQCEGQSVVHIFDMQAISSERNALNYRFKHFIITGDVEDFKADLSVRLSDEPWRPKNDRVLLIQPGQGGRSIDAAAFPLKTEALADIDGRTLIYKVADQQQIVSVICLDVHTKVNPRKAWEAAQNSWYMGVMR